MDIGAKYKNSRRLKRFTFDPAAMTELLVAGTFVECIDGVPKDGVFRGFTVDVERNVINIFVEHPSYEFVPEGRQVPEAPPAVLQKFDDPSIQVLKRFMKHFEEYNGQKTT